jgi:multicomponent Na+:H+ antiporter subunit B
MLGTLALAGQRKAKKTRSSWPALIVVSVTGAVLVYGTLEMPPYGSLDAPIHQYPSPSYIERSQHDIHGVGNVITAVLASYRGYDTLGETTVIFTAGIGVLLLLRGRRSESEELLP